MLMKILKFIGKVLWVTLKVIFWVTIGLFVWLIIRIIYGALGGDVRPVPPDPAGRYK